MAINSSRRKISLTGDSHFLTTWQIRKEGAVTTDTTIVTSTDLEMAVTQLSKSYDILRLQATQGFLFAGVMMCLGVFAILAGAVGTMFGLTAPTSNLTTVAGIIVEGLSALGLYLFNATFKQLNTTSDRLHDTWKILAAFRKASELDDGPDRSTLLMTIIARLVDCPPPKLSRTILRKPKSPSISAAPAGD